MHSSRQLVMESIASFNSIFLAALSDAARDRPHQFPLAQALVPHFAHLSPSDCIQRGALNVCLAEARFANAESWRPIDANARESQDENSDDFWVAAGDRVVLAHSLFLVAWHGAHSLPLLTQTLFGMAHNTNRLFQSTGFAGLLPLARKRAGWVYPRWRERMDVWKFLIEPQRELEERLLSPTLRVLQTCAAESISLAVTDFLEAIRTDEAGSLAPSRSSSPKARVSSTATRKAR
jgi:hypothetical protein